MRPTRSRSFCGHSTRRVGSDERTSEVAERGLDRGAGRSPAVGSGIRPQTATGTALVGVLQYVARRRSQLRGQSRARAQEDARASVASIHQQDGRDPDLDCGSRTARRQDRLAAGLWVSVARDLSDGRLAACFCSSPLGLWALPDLAPLERSPDQSAALHATGHRPRARRRPGTLILLPPHNFLPDTFAIRPVCDW